MGGGFLRAGSDVISAAGMGTDPNLSSALSVPGSRPRGLKPERSPYTEVPRAGQSAGGLEIWKSHGKAGVFPLPGAARAGGCLAFLPASPAPAAGLAAVTESCLFRALRRRPRFKLPALRFPGPGGCGDGGVGVFWGAGEDGELGADPSVPGAGEVMRFSAADQGVRSIPRGLHLPGFRGCLCGFGHRPPTPGSDRVVPPVPRSPPARPCSPRLLLPSNSFLLLVFFLNFPHSLLGLGLIIF